MKIGIMTHWWTQDNYGQILQCYALQQYLRDQGHEPFLIRYVQGKDTAVSPLYLRLLKAMNPIRLIKYIVVKIKDHTNKREKAKEDTIHPRGFESFREKHLGQSELIYYSWQDLKVNPPEADLYIVGSDQVWNFKGKDVTQFKSRIHSWFLDFGSEETTRISFAASWSQKEISQEQVEEIRGLISKFKFVSVREKSGLSICNQCGYPNARWFPDPVFLLPASAYRKLIPEQINSNPGKQKILFLYWLNNGSDYDLNRIFSWASRNHYQVKYITANNQLDSYPKEFPRVGEWLSMLDSAELVITNSFHCCVFSVLFQVPFAVVPLKGRNEGMNERLDSLFQMTGMEPRYLVGEEIDELLEAEIDFVKVEKSLSMNPFREDFSSLLKEISV